MNAIEKLRAEAREKRDAAIRTAKLDYKLTLAAIREAEKRLRLPYARRQLRKVFIPKTADDGPLAGYTSVAAAEIVLAELGPLTLPEIAAEIQARGCKPGHCPRKLIEGLRASFRYHEGRFVRGEDGRWAVGKLS